MRVRVSDINILIAQFLLAAVLVVSGAFAHAQSLPQALNISGGLFNPNGTPITSSSVAFKLEVMDKNSTCVLYSEEHVGQNLSQTKGAFSIQLGSGTSPANALIGGTAFDYQLFLNTGVVAPFGGCLAGVTLAAGDERMIRVSYNLGAGYVTMTPDVPIVSSAFAMVADTLRGKIPTDFVQTNGSSANLTQLNVENIFSNINYPKLNALLDGTSNQYLPTTPSAPVNFNGQRIVNLLDPTGAQDAATKNYADSNLGGKTIDSTGVSLGVGGGKTLVWDQALNKWIAQDPNSYVGGVVAGSGLLGGTITSFGTLSVDVGTNANQIVQLTNLSYLPAVDGHLLTNIQFPVLSVAGRTGAVTLNASDIGGLGTAAVKDYGTAAGNLVELAGASLLPALDGSLLTNVNATLLQSRAVANVAPAAGQILTWNSSASQWEPQNATIAGITDLTGDVTATGPGSAVATISANAVTSGKINNTGNVVNRLLITDATTGATVTYATCLQGEVMKYDITTGWGCAADVGAGGIVTAITSGTGMVAGTITSTGTLNVDVGTTAGKILQLNGSAQIPAVDGGIIANINAVRLQGRALASAAPVSGQVLGWTGSQWEPISVTSGTLAEIVASTGLLGGTINSNGTLSVDVGVTGNKIVQLTAGAQYPAVDGNLISNVNAVKIQGRDVASTAPGANQVLGWNAGTSQWEPLSAAVGSVTNVISGTGLVAGNISSFGTINVDVGVTANKILQLDSNAQIPAVDGFLVTNINAVKLQNRDLASTAPAAGQVIGWTGSQWEPISVTSGTLTQIVASTGLLGGTINSNGTVSVDVGITANKIVQLTAGAQYPAVDGNLISNVNAVKLQTRTVAATAPGDGQVLTWNNGTSVWEPKAPGAGADNLGNHIASQDLAMTNFSVLGLNLGTNGAPSLSFNGDATTGVYSPGASIVAVATAGAERLRVTANGMRLAPAALPGAPAAGDIAIDSAAANTLKYYNGSAWVSSSGTMTGVVSGTGLIAGTVTSYGTLNVDVGVAGNQIVQLTPGAQYPAVDGNLISNVNAVKIQGRDIASTAPSASQVLGWNAGASQWEPLSAAVGSVTNVISGTGLVAGNISSYGTINVDVGVTANKILQLDSNAQIPAVDGFLVTNVNAVKLQNRNLASSAPASGQVIGWTGTQWEPISVTSGTLTQIVASTGLLGGTINSNGTVSVDVGTTANQIVQLTAGAQYPAVDGNLISNVNAVNLQSRSVAATAPGDGQVLTWNNGTSVWEPKAPGAGADNLGNHIASQDLAMTNFSVTGLNLGTVGAPSLSFSGDATTGVYSPGASIVAVATAGAERLRVTANGMRLAPAALPGAPAAGDIAIDSGSANTLKFYNGSAWVSSSGTMTGVVSGTGLVAGTVTSYGTLSVDVGVTANKILQLDSNAQIPAVDGFLVTNINAVKLQNRDLASTAPAAGQVIGWTGSQWEPISITSGTLTEIVASTGLLGGTINSNGTMSVDVGVTGNKIVQLTAGAQYPAVDGNLISNVNAVKLQGLDVSSAVPANSQVLGWNASLASWEPTSATAGSVTSVTAGLGLVPGTISSSGTFNVDVGVGANKILQLDSNAQIPAVDGFLVTNINAVKLQNRVLASTAPASGQVIGWTGAQWEPVSITSGTLTEIVASTGLLGGTINSNGTVSVDVGVTANKIVQLTPSTQYPAVDGNLITNVNAMKIQGRDVAATAPTPSQILGWNGGTAQWEPISAATGSVTSVVAGTGLVASTISSAGTINVDVGVTANKVLQLDSNAQIPAVDGFLVTNVNAVKLQSRPIASAAPVANYVLTWNGSQWEPQKPTDTFGSLSSMGNGNNAYTPSSGALSYPGSGGSTSAWVSLYNTASNNGYFAMSLYHVKNSAGNAQFSYITSSSVSGGGSYSPVMAFGRSTASNAYTESMRIDENGSVGIGTSTPAPGAILDVNGTGTIGSSIVVPRGITALRPAAGTNGMIRYNSQTNRLEGFENGQWGNISAASSGTQSQWTTSGNDVYYSLGNVGIGTSAPATGLQISNGAGDVNSFLSIKRGTTDWRMYVSDSYTGTPSMRIGGGPPAKYAWQFDWSGSDAHLFRSPNGTAAQNVMNIIGSAGQSGIYLAVSSSAGPTGDKFTVSGSGSVGIGTSTPAPGAILDVNGTGTIGSAMVVPRDTTANQPVGVNGMIRYNTSTSKLESFENGAWGNMSASSSNAFVNGGNSFLSNANVGVTDNYALNLMTNNSARLTITALGNVGIGTTTPAQALQVAGAVMATKFVSPNQFSIGIDGGNSINFWNTWLGINYPMDSNTTRGFVIRTATGTAASPTYGISGNAGLGIYSPATDTLRIATGSADRVTFDQLGNVGIGTTTPRVALDVNGAIASAPAVNVTAGTVDFLRNNIAYTAQNCGNFDLWNMKDGATYTFAVQGTASALCVFTAYSGAGAGALTVKMPPGHGVTTATFQTIYSFLVAGSTVYVTWIPGY